MLEHVTSELALAVERDVTYLADMRFLLWASHVLARSRFRKFVFATFPEVQRRVIQIVQIVQIVDDSFISLPGLNATLFLLLSCFFIFLRLGFGTIFFDRRRFFRHKHAQ